MRRHGLRLGALLALAFIYSGAQGAPQPLVCEREMTRAAAKYGVPLGVLYAVGLTETGRRGTLSPYALNIEGPSVFPQTSEEALQRFYEA